MPRLIALAEVFEESQNVYYIVAFLSLAKSYERDESRQESVRFESRVKWNTFLLRMLGKTFLKCSLPVNGSQPD